MRMKQGVDDELEAAADELLRASMPGVTLAQKSHEWKRVDLLAPSSMESRIWPREVYNKTGVADPSIRRGQFSRPHNPRVGLRSTKPRAD